MYHDHHHDHHAHSRHVDENGCPISACARSGHNSRPGPVQWQVPHRRSEEKPGTAQPDTRDLDLVEASFVEGFARCSDPTSFLRLAGVPFTAAQENSSRTPTGRI